MSLKRIFFLSFFIGSLSFGFSQTKVMSFNIRYDNKNDGDNWWNLRKMDVANQIAYYHPDFIGIQEALVQQLNYLDQQLKEYSYVGVGRDDGKEKGEFSPIFYNEQLYGLLKMKTLWLSETPEKVSVGWDASMERIVTYGAFLHKKTGDTIHVFNAHFDHVGSIARENSAKLIVKTIAEYGLESNKTIVMGDFNSEPNEAPILVFKNALDDAQKLTKTKFYGPIGTFNGFDTSKVIEKRIDYIFTKNMKVKSYRHIDVRRSNNLFVSDHLAVFAELDF